MINSEFPNVGEVGALERAQNFEQRITDLKREQRQVKNQLNGLWHELSTGELALDGTLKAFIKKLQKKNEDILRTIRRLERKRALPIQKSDGTGIQAVRDGGQKQAAQSK